MSLKIAWKQNILVTDFHLLKSLLVVFGLGSQAFVCGFSRQNICSVAQLKIKSILNFELGIAIFVNTCGELLLYYRTLIESKLQTKKMPLNFKGICIIVVIWYTLRNQIGIMKLRQKFWCSLKIFLSKKEFLMSMQ